MQATPNNLGILRKKAGLTLAELGEKTGLNLKTISGWEAGRKIPPEALPRLAAGLRCTSEEILRFFPEPEDLPEATTPEELWLGVLISAATSAKATDERVRSQWMRIIFDACERLAAERSGDAAISENVSRKEAQDPIAKHSYSPAPGPGQARRNVFWPRRNLNSGIHPVVEEMIDRAVASQRADDAGGSGHSPAPAPVPSPASPGELHPSGQPSDASPSHSRPYSGKKHISA